MAVKGSLNCAGYDGVIARITAVHTMRACRVRDMDMDMAGVEANVF